jgi:hypothetical protein
MSNIVSLFDYKKQKEEEELDVLEAAVNTIITELGDELQAQPYFGYDDVAPQTFGVSMAINNIETCCSTLRWISYILSILKKDEEANKIDNIVTRLEGVATDGE